MAETRKVEVFSAGCAFCEQAIEMVRNAACSSCEDIRSGDNANNYW